MSPTVRDSISRYEHGTAWASALQEALWRGRAKTTLGEEIAGLLAIGRPLTDEERGFFDCLEERLSA